jgi:hypothetical protein
MSRKNLPNRMVVTISNDAGAVDMLRHACLTPSLWMLDTLARPGTFSVSAGDGLQDGINPGRPGWSDLIR